jgi:DNA primase large subunit
MDPLYARYPCFEGAREAVREADLSPAALVEADAPAVERGRERVERALMEGTVAPAEPRQWDADTEVLSYPIARILVSLLDTPAAVEKYATAEAATARERFEADFAADGELRSAGRTRASLDDALREFDLADAVRPERDGSGTVGANSGGRGPTHYWVGLGSYLDLADTGWGRRWRLVNREVADGEVRVTREELSRLLEAAVKRRVASGLPLEIRGSEGGDAIAEALAGAISDLRELLNDADGTGHTPVEAVVPALFPPCMRTLVQRAREGEALPTTAEFSLTAFLVALGMDDEEVTTLLDVEAGTPTADRIGARVEFLAERDGTQYPPPSCATMKAYGDCVDPDERCETISHPLSYYTDAVRAAGDVRDWREATGG